MNPQTSTPIITTPASTSAASASYMALLLSAQGALVPTHDALHSQVIHVESTLSYAIACTGYTESHKLTQLALEAAQARLKVRNGDLELYANVLARDQTGVHIVHLPLLCCGLRDLERDVRRLGELVLRAGENLAGDFSGRKGGLFEMDVHLKAVGMVGVRWELEGLGF